MKIQAIYISPGHNFFGHYGQEPGSHPARDTDKADCVAGRGLRGDRFFDHKDNYKGQITFFADEVYRDLCRTLSVYNKGPWVLRRNVLTREADLNELIGKEFEVQGIRFEGAAECAPCLWMNHAFGQGAEEFLCGRGGLRARILTSGTLRKER